jgi:hypothetical protein
VFSLKYFNLLFVISSGLIGAIGGLCFGYENGIIGDASLYFEDEYRKIT